MASNNLFWSFITILHTINLTAYHCNSILQNRWTQRRKKVLSSLSTVLRYSFQWLTIMQRDAIRIRRKRARRFLRRSSAQSKVSTEGTQMWRRFSWNVRSWQRRKATKYLQFRWRSFYILKNYRKKERKKELYLTSLSLSLSFRLNLVSLSNCSI